MHPLRKQRLIIVLFVIFGAALAVGFITYALRESINLFYPPADIAEGKAPIGKSIRAGGMVQAGSVKRDPNSLRVEFSITDYRATVKVIYTGILPDLFAEGQGIVAAGKLDEKGVFIATEVLAKHDENYMPPEVQDALDQSEKAYSEQASSIPVSASTAPAPASTPTPASIPTVDMTADKASPESM